MTFIFVGEGYNTSRSGIFFSRLLLLAWVCQAGRKEPMKRMLSLTPVLICWVTAPLQSTGGSTMILAVTDSFAGPEIMGCKEVSMPWTAVQMPAGSCAPKVSSCAAKAARVRGTRAGAGSARAAEDVSVVGVMVTGDSLGVTLGIDL